MQAGGSQHGQDARPEKFDASSRNVPGGGPGDSLLKLCAAAADQVERAGQDYCDNDENHVEH
jgi:hypothetical protein